MEPRTNTQESNTTPKMVESNRCFRVDFRITYTPTCSVVGRSIMTMNTSFSALFEDVKFAIGNFDDEEKILKSRTHTAFYESRVGPAGFGAGTVGM